jgi:hypothetical protein
MTVQQMKQIILGIVTAAFVFGAYFIGLFQGQRHPIQWREFFRTVKGSLTRRGFAWAVALPAVWVLFYYAFIAHVWFSLGRRGLANTSAAGCSRFTTRRSGIFFERSSILSSRRSLSFVCSCADGGMCPFTRCVMAQPSVSRHVRCSWHLRVPELVL